MPSLFSASTLKANYSVSVSHFAVGIPLRNAYTRFNCMNGFIVDYIKLPAKLFRMLNLQLMPIVGITGFACSLCMSYIGYSLRQKGDVSLRFGKKDRMPERDVGPDDIRKLLVIQTPKSHDAEIEKLRSELNSHYEN